MTAVNELLVRIDATTAQLRREMTRADSIVTGSSRKMDRELAKLDKRFDVLNKAAGLATKALVGYVGVMSVSRITSYASSQMAAAQAIGQMAETANISTQALQELRYGFTSLAKVTDGEVDGALRRFNRRLGLAREGAGPAKKAFDQMFGGVDQFGTTEQALDAVIERLAGIEDGARRAGIASAYFGDDAGPMLAAALGKGSDAMNQLRKDAHAVGLVLDDKVIKNADQIRTDFDRVSRIMSVTMMNALNEMAPLMLEIATSATRFASALGWGYSEEGKLYSQLDIKLAEIQRLEDIVSRGAAGGIGRGAGDAALATIHEALKRAREEADELSVAIGELASGKRTGAGAGSPITISIGDPQQLAAIKLQFEQQLQLNESLYQGADAYKHMTAEIERSNAVRAFEAQLAKQNINDPGLVADYDLMFQGLQKLTAEQDEHNKRLAEAKQVQEALLGPVDKYNQQLDLLDALLEKNLISWDAYSRSVAGATNELEEFGKTGNQALKDIELAVQGFGRSFEDTMVEAAKTGQLSFARMTEAILEDILRIVLRAQIIRPMLQGLGQSFPSLNLTANANGNVIRSGNVIPFAKGGVVSSPVMFPMAGSKTGLMGEAGEEGIFPLMRGKDGKLGVKADVSGAGGGAVVQIIDQRSGGQQPQVEQSRGPDGRQIIRVLIRDEVKAALSGGALDRTMADNYGIRRRSG